MASASDRTSGAPLMKLTTRQAKAKNVSMNAGPIFDNAIERKQEENSEEDGFCHSE